jgi:hypothetical protein
METSDIILTLFILIDVIIIGVGIYYITLFNRPSKYISYEDAMDKRSDKNKR